MNTRAFISRLLVACALLLGLQPARAVDPTAGFWREIGLGSAGDNGLSNETLGNAGPPAVATDGANIYVAWESGASEIFVRRWNGTAWGEVGVGSAAGGGISNNAGHSRFPSIVLAPDGTPVVA